MISRQRMDVVWIFVKKDSDGIHPTIAALTIADVANYNDFAIAGQ